MSSTTGRVMRAPSRKRATNVPSFTALPAERRFRHAVMAAELRNAVEQCLARFREHVHALLPPRSQHSPGRSGIATTCPECLSVGCFPPSRINRLAAVGALMLEKQSSAAYRRDAPRQLGFRCPAQADPSRYRAGLMPTTINVGNVTCSAPSRYRAFMPMRSVPTSSAYIRRSLSASPGNGQERSIKPPAVTSHA
jgi:hypothetical protein